MDAELISSFECPVCYEMTRPPMMPCQAGHIICPRCYDKLLTCPVCRGRFPNTRNREKEELYNNTLIPCRNRESGCEELVLGARIQEHEENCGLQKMHCPLKNYMGCNWNGNLQTLHEHCVNEHPLRYFDDGCFYVDIAVAHMRNWNEANDVVVKKSGKFFLVSLDVDQGWMRWCAFLLGRSQTKFYYRVQLCGKDGEFPARLDGVCPEIEDGDEYSSQPDECRRMEPIKDLEKYYSDEFKSTITIFEIRA